MNPPQAPRGAPVLAVITGLERFPTQIVGGGSGEFFSFCFGSPRTDPTEPGTGTLAEPVVVALTVPPDAPVGPRQVEVVFSEGTVGSTAPDQDRVRLTADFEVTADPVPLRPKDPDTPPCGTSTRTPPSGSLSVTPDRTPPGSSVRVRIGDPPPGLLYVVCLLGNAVVAPGADVEGADAPTPPLDLTVAVPTGTPAGAHQVRVLALTGGPDPAWVGWRQTIRVAATGTTPRIPVGGVDAGGGALATEPTSPLPLAGLAAGGVLVAAVVVRRRRAR